MDDQEWQSGGAYVAYEWLTEERQRVLDIMTLEELGELRRALDSIIFDRVQTYRETGSTWAEIGQELHVTMQEAHRRYAVRGPRLRRAASPKQ